MNCEEPLFVIRRRTGSFVREAGRWSRTDPRLYTAGEALEYLKTHERATAWSFIDDTPDGERYLKLRLVHLPERRKESDETEEVVSLHNPEGTAAS